MDLRPVDGDNHHQLRVSHHERLEQLVEQKQRRLQGLTPLPQRSFPRPWEDLSSLLSRVAKQTGYDRPERLLRTESPPHKINSTNLPLTSCRTSLRRSIFGQSCHFTELKQYPCRDVSNTDLMYEVVSTSADRSKSEFATLLPLVYFHLSSKRGYTLDSEIHRDRSLDPN